MLIQDSDIGVLDMFVLYFCSSGS